ncbi:MAG: methionine adenosyltransferase [Candidatus Binatia bacterium]
MQIIVESFDTLPLARQRCEIVERKGIGHPDTICDSVMEAISIALCREYERVAGEILHHNVDKSLLLAGQAVKHCGGGQILRPMELIMGDRATNQIPHVAIPVQDIAVSTAQEWFRDHLPHVDLNSHVRFRPAMAPGSVELTDIFRRGGAVLGANDTSAAVGHGPLTPLEHLVIDLEMFLNGPQFKTQFPDTGQDVKIMARRTDARVQLTVAMPLLAVFTTSVGEYFARKAAVHEAMLRFVRQTTSFTDIEIAFNPLDDAERGEGGIYLSLTGTSAEDADSGEVGRGNRVSGVIAFHRPAGAEAAAGKNPVSHVGKIYNVLAHRLAQEMVTELPGLEAVSLWIVSRIGQPIDRPSLVHIKLTSREEQRSSRLLRAAEDLVRARLAHMTEFCRALAKGEYSIC